VAGHERDFDGTSWWRWANPFSITDFNDLGIADNLVDPKSLWLTANDTAIYAIAAIDLAQA
jgi:hypothetical protein